MTDLPPTLPGASTVKPSRLPVEKDKLVLLLFGAITVIALGMLYLSVKAQDILAIITPLYTGLGFAWKGGNNSDG